MAAISAASGPTSFGHQNDAQDEYTSWNRGSTGPYENTLSHSFAEYDGVNSPQSAPTAQNGATDDYFDLRESRSNSRATAPPQTKRAKDGTILTYDDENSKWIHRDLLAKIENEELQAAGIVLPKPRTQSRSRRDRSHSRRRGTIDSSEQQSLPTSRKNPELSRETVPDTEVANWDLRLPEEIAEEPNVHWTTNSSGKRTRIPVAKASPAPIPVDYIDRDAPRPRKSSVSALDDEASILYPKTRSRSSSNANVLDDPHSKAQSTKRGATEVSPKKNTPRKTTAPVKATTQGRSKTRSGSAPRSGSATRPTTRSGEASTRAPEGEPPWMISAYQPDPRLPPDQQLLPTVAKRLQQEKWEQEGVFGSVYDKEFRPLNQDPFPQPPPEVGNPQQETEEVQNEWPLRPEDRVPTPTRPGTSSYSTMPKISDTPTMSPLGSPRPVQQPNMQTAAAAEIPEPPEQPEEKKEKGGCGCCLVM